MLYSIEKQKTAANTRSFDAPENGRMEYTMYEQIVEILAKQLRIDPSKISEDTDIVEDLGADSLDVVEMLMELEAAFSLSVPDEEIADLKTPKDIFDYVVAHEK